MWVGRETEEFFITGEINAAIAQAQQSGIVAWTLETGDATSTLTHPRMFAYFKTEATKYRFQHMITSSHLIIYNTNRIHTSVMLPWVQCALSYSCISPVGAESSYCPRRRPRYLYSGCHHYDESALNIILGQVFNFAENEYTYAGTSVIFGRETTTNSSLLSSETTAKYSGNLGYTWLPPKRLCLCSKMLEDQQAMNKTIFKWYANVFSAHKCDARAQNSSLVAS